MTAPRLAIKDFQLFERPVTLRLPFRFGVITLTEAREAIVRVAVELESGESAWGVAAEMLAPKWFDKNPELSNDENVEQLRLSLRTACGLYGQGGGRASAFGHFARHYEAQIEACADLGLNALIACYGPALLDRAVLDGLCRALGVSFYEAIGRNLAGIEATEFAPVSEGFDFGAFLATLKPAQTIHARHTVGLVDPITAADQAPGDRVGDGLPETLEEVISAYGQSYFKVKVGGDLEADIARLTDIAAVLDTGRSDYHVSLDGNEQYDDVDGVLGLWEAMAAKPQLRRFVGSILYIEQPIHRQTAVSADIRRLAAKRPVIIDESDADFDAFPNARALGYQGVSSKTCKGIYRSLINLARARVWSAADDDCYFLSAEDLTTQAGVSVQQDLALVTLLGLTHVERNGHHYVHGMAGYPLIESEAFLAKHGDLYGRVGDTVCLRITDGKLAIGSLGCTGFATAAQPDWASLEPMGD